MIPFLGSLPFRISFLGVTSFSQVSLVKQLSLQSFQDRPGYFDISRPAYRLKSTTRFLETKPIMRVIGNSCHLFTMTWNSGSMNSTKSGQNWRKSCHSRLSVKNIEWKELNGRSSDRWRRGFVFLSGENWAKSITLSVCAVDFLGSPSTGCDSCSDVSPLRHQSDSLSKLGMVDCPIESYSQTVGLECPKSDPRPQWRTEQKPCSGEWQWRLLNQALRLLAIETSSTRFFSVI